MCAKRPRDILPSKFERSHIIENVFAWSMQTDTRLVNWQIQKSNIFGKANFICIEWRLVIATLSITNIHNNKKRWRAIAPFRRKEILNETIALQVKPTISSLLEALALVTEWVRWRHNEQCTQGILSMEPTQISQIMGWIIIISYIKSYYNKFLGAY